jgi:hypothetical protein
VNLAAVYAQKDLYPWGKSEPSTDKANYDGYLPGLTRQVGFPTCSDLVFTIWAKRAGMDT